MRERARSELLKSNPEEKKEKGERVGASQDDRAKGRLVRCAQPDIRGTLGVVGRVRKREGACESSLPNGSRTGELVLRVQLPSLLRGEPGSSCSLGSKMSE